MTTWLRLPEAAAYAKVSDATIRREVSRGALRAFRVGGRKALRFRTSDLDQWLTLGATIEKPADVLCLTCDIPIDPANVSDYHRGHNFGLRRGSR
jgi:excisionase family DNA binding protein